MGGRALGGAGIRDMLADDRVWCVLGTVALHDGETEHYEVNEDGDIQVTVVAHQHGTPITAILGGAFGSAAGAWVIPAAGDEVLVCFADGEFEGDAVVVAVTTSRSAPAGLAPGTVLVRADDRVQADAPEVLLGGGAGHEPTLKATTYRSAEDALISALSTWATAVATALGTIPTFIDPGKAAFTAATAALQAAITAFGSAAASAPTTVTKVK
jgi:hypothetical protein